MFVYWTLVQYGKNWDFKQKSEYQSRESGVEGKSPLSLANFAALRDRTGNFAYGQKSP
jgi:hypothetical protein